jgi:uncharacterized phiE125 gp8 family phage protein
MGLTRIIEPVNPAITYDTAKAYLHLSSDSDQLYIEDMLIPAVTRLCEDQQNRGYINQTYRLGAGDFRSLIKCDREFGDIIPLKRSPVQSISSISYVNRVGVTQVVDPRVYKSVLDFEPGFIRLNYGFYWPYDYALDYARVNIDFVVGYGPTFETVPRRIKLTMLQLIAHFYTNRQAVVVSTAGPAIAAKVPYTFNYLIDSDRVW